MNQHFSDTRKIDPTRADRVRPDGTPDNDDRAEIGPTPLAFAEWAAAGITPPNLARMREDRHARLVNGINDRGYGGALFFDPLNIRFATDATNMQLWNAHNPFRACFVAADGHMVLFEYKGSYRFLSGFNPLVSEVRGGAAMFYFSNGDRLEQDAHNFAGELGDLMAELGFLWGDDGKQAGGVVEAEDPAFQARIWGVRTQGLNIMMSMKSDGKPVSFVEDCAVELPDLAAYTTGLTEIFEKHGTRGTWYAHASVGCLHVRPVLNLKLDQDVASMRAIAEECFDLVARYKGSHSGEHGDGIVRSAFHEKMFGPKMVESFNEVKDRFDPNRLFNPNKIVQPPKMDDRRLFRYGPDYAVKPMKTALDWSAWPGAGGGGEKSGAWRDIGSGIR